MGCWTNIAATSAVKGILEGVRALVIADGESFGAEAVALDAGLSETTAVPACSAMQRVVLQIDAATKTSCGGCAWAGKCTGACCAALAGGTSISAAAAMEVAGLGIDASALAKLHPFGATADARTTDLSAWAGLSAFSAVIGVTLGIDTTAKADGGCAVGALGDALAFCANLPAFAEVEA